MEGIRNRAMFIAKNPLWKINKRKEEVGGSTYSNGLVSFCLGVLGIFD